MASRQRFIFAICTPKSSCVAGRCRSVCDAHAAANNPTAMTATTRFIRISSGRILRTPTSHRPTLRHRNQAMSDVAIRDRLLAYALLGYITPARARLLLDAGFPCNASARFIQQGLRIDDPDREREVREPLTVERVQRALALYRDSSLTLADDGYPELLRHLPDPPLALFY